MNHFYHKLSLCCFILSLHHFSYAQTQTADSLFQQATTLFTQGAYQQSLPIGLYADSLFHATGAVEKELVSKIFIAKNYTVLRNFKKVITVSEAAKQLLDAAGKRDSLIEADLLNTYAGSLLEVRRFAETEATYRRAIAIKRSVLGEKTPEIGIQISNLANLYFKKGELQKAMQYGKQGITIREAGIVPNPKLMTAYINLGIIHKQAGLYQYALGYFNKAQQVLKQAPDKYQEKAGPLYQSLSSLYHDLGDYEQAQQYAELAIFHFSQKFGPNCIQLADIYYNLALLASDLKDPIAQTAHIKKALEIQKTNANPDLYKLADCYEQTCISFMNINADSMLYYAHLSGALLDTLEEQGGLERASNISYFAMTYAQKDQYSKADSLMFISETMVRDIYGKQHILTANYLTNHANILYKAGQYKTALKLYDASLAGYGYTKGCNLDTVVHANELLDNLIKRNRTLIHLYDQQPNGMVRDEIDAAWVEIVHLLDYLRRRHQGNEAKLLFAHQFKEGAEDAINWYLRAGKENYPMAWQFAEKSRALALLEAFRNANAWSLPQASDSLHVQADVLIAENKKWYNLYANAENDLERSEYLTQLMQVRAQQEICLRNLEKTDATFYKAKYDNRVVTIPEVRSLLRPRQALLEYFVGDSSLFLFVVRKDTLIVQQVKKDFPLESWITDFQQGLYGYYTTEKAKRTSALNESSLGAYLKFAPILHDKLIEPVKKWLPAQVLLVTDGVLGFIPFDALLNGAPQDINNFKTYPYLLNQYQFSYSYSATLIPNQFDNQQTTPTERRFLTFAPFYEQDTLLIAAKDGSIRPTKGQSAPIAIGSTDPLHLRMGGDVVAGAYAQKNRFVEMAFRYRILHIAAHGIADNRVGDYAYLTFAKSNDTSKTALLYAKDIYQLRLKADLIVLSACETAVGKVRRGEGIISLARAFSYAGAKSTVTTLWKIADDRTAELMDVFYQYLGEGRTKDEALRLARMRYLEQSNVRSCHPFYWAAFVPQGDMRPLN